MNATPERAGRHSRGVGSGGFSLIEMIVAITVSVIIGVGLYFVFNAQQRASRSQRSYNDLQTNCTFAMDTIKNDLLLAGYRSKSATQPISAANASSVTFEFWDDNASADPPYDDVTQFTNHTQISFSYDSVAKTLSKTIRRWHTVGGGQYDTPTTFVLADNVDGLTFEYLAQDSAAWTAAAGLDKIRSVRINLLCRAGREDALYKDEQGNVVNPNYQYQKIALTAEVRPRNVAIAENPEDVTAPSVPSPVTKVWDEGQCGCLRIRWPSSSESDIGGYTVFYGLAPGQYIGRTRVTHQDVATQSTTLRNLTAVNAPYYIALAAYDKSGNQSGLSSEVSANPVVSVRTESDPGNDSAITPLPPAAPGAPTIGTPADNQIRVSWTQTYSDCLTTPVSGYRIYRSTDASFTPEGNAAGLGNCIADEGTLGSDATSYLDLGLDSAAGYLVGCVPYYYKVAVVHCDSAQLNAYTDNDAATASTYTDANFASITGTPTDGTQTSVPVLTSKAGYRRIILSLTNPSRAAGQHPDFVHTKVYFSTTAPGPQLTATRDAEGYYVVNNGWLIPDNGGIVSAGGGPNTINFDDENNEVPPGGLGDPQLQADQTYYFLAVAYDICKNASEDREEARSTAEQCNDCLLSEPVCRDAPPMATNLRVTEGCGGAPLRLEWYYDPANYTSDPDFQGFRVIRCEGAGCVPLDPVHGGSGTLMTGTYLSPDPYLVDDTVVYGRIYNYRIYAGDCYYQRWLEGLLTPADIADNDPTNNASTTDISGLSLGYLDRARVVGGDQQTTLTADIDASVTTIPVVSTSGWTHRRLQINTETIECNGLTPTSFTDCQRGREASIAIAHFGGTPVRSFPSALPRAAVTGDITQVPPTFLHNSVIVGARNTSAMPITLQTLYAAWDDTDAWFKRLIYDEDGGAVTMFEDGSTPLAHGSGGSTLTLSLTQVPAAADDVPVKFEFLKSDGTVDTTVDLREESIDLIWGFRNDSTDITTCSRSWLPPGLTGIIGPTGPTVGGTTQSVPTAGTTAWPVPGATSNSLNAVIAPSNSSNVVTTNVHDTSGTGIASVRLYYTSTDAAVTSPPEVTGDYPGLDPYTMVTLSNVAGETWSGEVLDLSTAGQHNGRNVWYFIVAVDNDGNFDREPEAGQGAFQYFQQPEDPCLNTPKAPELVLSDDASNVYLDWSASWTGTPPTYENVDGSACIDLAGFRVYHRMGNRAWQQVSGSPFAPTTDSYTQTFTTAASSLSLPVAALTPSPLTLTVSATGAFLIPGKVKIDDEIFSCTGSDATHLNGCTRAQAGTVAADHALGASVTQDPLLLDANSFYVQAFDTCSTGAKFSNSNALTEGVCTPACTFYSSSPIQAGQSFTVKVEACEKAGNGVQDMIWVHVCSSVEGDDFPLTEDAGDTGYFEGNVATKLSSAAEGGNTMVSVQATDTITVGGYASAANSWGDINACTGKTYGCGAARYVEVHEAPTDPCAADHTPSNVVGVPVSSRVGTDTCSGSLRRQLLTWSAVTFPAGCTSTGYDVSYRYQDNQGVWTAYAAANFAGSPICDGTNCQSTLDPTPTKINGNAYEFQVTAVCERNDCVEPSTGATYPRSWESASPSAAAADACP